METKTIRIVIQEMEQDGEIYYFADSPDIPGFLAETETLKEMLEIAPLVMQDLLEVRNERLAKQKKFENVFKKLNISLSFNRFTSLQLAT
jgi:predicted RNase H-like HicB family nuclease